MTPEILTGRTETHLVHSTTLGIPVNGQTEKALSALFQAARRAGFAPTIVSGFRSFTSQLTIWNGKVSGKRPVLDRDSRTVDIQKLTPTDLVAHILRWSALPGASRHHWGSDFDIVDMSRAPKEYQARLVPLEFSQGGVFHEFHDWLDDRLPRFEFFRPYSEDLGGVSPERWHLSHAPVAKQYLDLIDDKIIGDAIDSSEMLLKETVLPLLPHLFVRYVSNISAP